jgi:hypothetical protein
LSRILVESIGEILRNHLSRLILDVPPLEHPQQLAVAHQGNRRRRRRITGEITASALGGFDVRAREHRGNHVRLRVVLQRHRDARPCFSGGASAHRVDDHHHGRSLLIARLFKLSSEYRIDIGRGAKFANAEAGQFLAHRGYEEFWVCHNLNIIS